MPLVSIHTNTNNNNNNNNNSNSSSSSSNDIATTFNQAKLILTKVRHLLYYYCTTKYKNCMRNVELYIVGNNEQYKEKEKKRKNLFLFIYLFLNCFFLLLLFG